MFILCAIAAILVFLLTGGLGFPVSIILLLVGALAGGGSNTEVTS